MSIEALLLPLGLAAFAAIREARSTDLCEKCRPLRVKDPQLLTEALERLGQRITQRSPDRILATGELGNMTFQKVGEVFLGRVDRASDQMTLDALARIDQQVGLIVQAQTAARLEAEAQLMGYRLVQTTTVDGSINYVFEEA